MRARFSFGLRRRVRRAQAAVESAIVIPMMTFMILGVLQLAMIQHARIMTEYAAFNAARAGIVWNADPWIMENAAIISLLPTYEKLSDQALDPETMVLRIVQRALLYQINRRLPQAVDLVRSGTDAIIAQLPAQIQGGAGNLRDTALNAAEQAADQGLQDAINGVFGAGDLKMVQVRILSPTMAQMALRSPEVDFDNVRDSNDRSASRLSIEIRYLYMMRIPFANWIMHQAWRAHRAGQELYGALHAAELGNKDATVFSGGGPAPVVQGPSNLDATLNGMSQQGVYMIPLRAQYTMRMQSNPYRVSLMMQDISGE